ncbi:carbonate dehydratase [Thioalkalivibrio denitrificans]|uniref:Carbonate dehydratase n=1 Tax=Thioalkalivibrio denitrificans TaxID=108003 RepID=A0A1V3NUY3_9GAMM|nr:cation-transporting P-type ATPase [Thioalkalivibrio denitrificans]OOG28841.1 carbonate dehydratase [Thioalkalivibrio denitrificans]
MTTAAGDRGPNEPIPAAGERPWHALEANEVLAAFVVDSAGLTPQESARRLALHGPNALPPPPQRSPWRRFLAQFQNVLIYVLLASAFITALLAEWVDTAVILAVVVINAIVGFLQEGKAESALVAIREGLARRATVLRAGERHEVPAETVAPGELVVLEPGDRIAADLRLIEARGLRVDEASLTGESVPVDKGSEAVAPATHLAERFGMAYAGTLVRQGRGIGVAVGTGSGTELSRISALLCGIEPLTTPLLRQMDRFARVLSLAIVGGAALLFAVGTLWRGFSAEEMFLAAVGLAVAAIPEGLPAILTIVLAIGVQRMARRNAIVRRLPAVETLGAVTVICSDKTGTLTRNEMTVRHLVTAGGRLQVSGAGYALAGGFQDDGREVVLDEWADAQELILAGLLCNDARLLEHDGEWRVQGDPTEGALLVLAGKAGLDLKLDRERRPRLDAIPFESAHRFMATLHHDLTGHHFVVVKGALEAVLPRCARQRSGGEDRPLDPAFWHAQVEDIAAAGDRLLALAYAILPADRTELTLADLDQGLTLLGLVGIADPPRDEAREAVGRCQAAGIRVKMITGDHAMTAAAIAGQLGIAKGRVVNGAELDTMDGVALRRAAAAASVFARAAPEHKLRLVEALQANGEVVVMTGDGVNDAPALKRAEVGVAMGRKGTEAAREAAEMVLADDNFATIAHAVEEGRTIYDNLKKSILFILPTNGAEASVIAAAILLGVTLPITPAQILWVNMITAVTLALALTFEPPEGDLMARPPRRADEPLLSGYLVWRVVLVSTLLTAGILWLFLWELTEGDSLDSARTVAVNALVMGEIFYLFNTRFLHRSVLRGGLRGNRAIWISIALLLTAQLAFTYAAPFQALFSTAPITLAGWGLCALVGFALLLIVEVEKWLLNHRQTPRHGQEQPS